MSFIGQGFQRNQVLNAVHIRPQNLCWFCFSDFSLDLGVCVPWGLRWRLPFLKWNHIMSGQNTLFSVSARSYGSGTAAQEWCISFSGMFPGALPRWCRPNIEQQCNVAWVLQIPLNRCCCPALTACFQIRRTLSTHGLSLLDLVIQGYWTPDDLELVNRSSISGNVCRDVCPAFQNIPCWQSACMCSSHPTDLSWSLELADTTTFYMQLPTLPS